MKKFTLSGFAVFALFQAATAQNISPYWSLSGNSNAASTSKLGTTNKVNLPLFTNNLERMRIDTLGNVGIGTTKPTERLAINGLAGKNALRVQVNSGTKLLVASNGGTSIGASTTPPTNGLYVAGNVGIGMAAPANTLHVRLGSSGATPVSVAPLVVESNYDSYINMLVPANFETGILFGRNSMNNNGGIIYNNINTRGGLQFRTGENANRMVLTYEGYLGVGTMLPGRYQLRVTHGNFGFDLQESGSGNHWEQYVDATTGNLYLFYNSLQRGDFNSTTGAYTSISDARLKTAVKPMPSMLEKIKQLKPSMYQFKGDKNHAEYQGFIAQEVLPIFPSLVNHNVNPRRKVDVYTLDYSGFSVVAIKAIQELDSANRAKDQQIAALEARLSKLEAAISGNNPRTLTSSYFEQATPNPAQSTVRISYNLPQGRRGQLLLTDAQGKTIKVISLNSSGTVNINTTGLSSGVYNYSLLIDGSITDTKRLTIAR